MILQRSGGDLLGKEMSARRVAALLLRWPLSASVETWIFVGQAYSSSVLAHHLNLARVTSILMSPVMAVAISSNRVLFTVKCFLFATGKVSSTEISPHDISNSTRKRHSRTADAVEYHHNHPQMAGYGPNILVVQVSTAASTAQNIFPLFCPPAAQIRREVVKLMFFLDSFLCHRRCILTIEWPKSSNHREPSVIMEKDYCRFSVVGGTLCPPRAVPIWCCQAGAISGYNVR